LENALLIQYFIDQGFKLELDNNSYSQIAVVPDFIFEKDSVIKVIVLRESSSSIPITFIQRFANSKRIPNKTLELYFALPSKPSMQILRDCKSFAIGVLYTDNKNEVQIYAQSKQIKGRKIIATIPKTQIFFSSRQHLEERVEANDLINDLRDSLRVPIFSMLVENDQQYSNDIRKLWPIICRCMDDCQYVLVILSGEYRKIIDRETRRALEYYEPEDILFYVKNNKQTKEEWKDLIDLASSNNVKYTAYFDLRDFKLKFNQRLMRIIIKLHEDNGIQFLADRV